MEITVIGGGHVGLPVAAVFADRGNRVVCCERDPAKLACMRAGLAPFNEPGLDELVSKNLQAGSLAFQADLPGSVRGADLCFVTVATAADGHPQLTATVTDIVRHIPEGSVIALKSTMQPGTADKIARAAGERAKVAVNPEFLRQGSAVTDFRSPERIVIGANDESTLETMRKAYAPWRESSASWLEVTRTEAEIVKAGANCFLATRVALINEIYDLCEATGADIRVVRDALAADSRIGGHYLSPGIGFGGSCLPKDCELLAHAGRSAGSPMAVVEATTASNNGRQTRLADRIASLVHGLPDPAIAVWGLTFKPDSDDMRDSIALGIVDRLSQGRPSPRLRLHDPWAPKDAAPACGELFADWRESLEGADALVVLVAHSAYKGIRPEEAKGLMRGDAILDVAGVLEG